MDLFEMEKYKMTPEPTKQNEKPEPVINMEKFQFDLVKNLPK
jgi:hypothetical protein